MWMKILIREPRILERARVWEKRVMQPDDAGPEVGPAHEMIRAEAIARCAHFGQVDKFNEPYIKHVERVVAAMDGSEAKAVAWLHDVVEDTPISGAALAAAGISPRVVRAVMLLTRQEPDDYARHIATIHRSGDELAIAVKLADLRDHLRPGCPESLRPRYEAALAALEKR
jgi:(p)ppGpp synthase/HD superfamily hydrolase